MTTKLLLTGGTGYAGRCFIDTILRETDWQIISLQRDIFSAKSIENPRVELVGWDFTTPFPLAVERLAKDVRYFVHLGAYVHAMKSLKDPGAFVKANVLGTYHVLELARALRPELFAYISTAEVLGGIDAGGYSAEWDALKPSNPYSATKGAGELLTYSYFRSFDLPSIIVRTMNLYGDDQDDMSKFVPMVRESVKKGEKVKIHCRDGKPGVRQWLAGNSFAKQLLDLLIAAKFGETYHIVGEELSNLEMAQRVAEQLGMPLKYELVRISKTHEWRYAMGKNK